MTITAFLISLSPTDAEAKTYKLDEFSFEIPNGCKVDHEKNRFQTDTTHLDCGNDKEMVFEVGTFDELVDMNATTQDMVSEVESNLQLIYGDDNPDIFESGADKYTINNFRAPYALATFTHTGYNLFGAELTKDMANIMIAIKIGDNKVVAAQFLAPQEDFDKFLPKAEGAFKSVKAIGSSSSTTETETSDDTDTNTNTGTYNPDKSPETSKLCNNPNTELAKELCDKLIT